MSKHAVRHIAKTDPVMRQLIREHGAFKINDKDTGGAKTTYASLICAIAYQQIHGKAAEAILGRFKALYPGRKFPPPDNVLATPDQKLRAVGFSVAKIQAIKDIAAKTLSGHVPTMRQMAKMEDSAIVERLVALRGVGRWTVEMLLIFQLKRINIWPVGDFAVRDAFRIAYKKRKMPTERELIKFGERWQPYRTVAAWYLWRLADSEKVKKANGKKAKKA
jgi:DNA-3-methyladenine glycosylase II